MKNKIKTWAPAMMLVLALAMAVGGVSGIARAALTYYSDRYDLDIEVPAIGVTLRENGKDVAWRDYYSGDSDASGSRSLLSWADAIKPGEYYDEALTVRNSGDIESYVKLEVYKYWTDNKGNKITTLSPDQIELDLGDGMNWYVDEDASTAERTVLYYLLPLAAGASTDDACTELRLDGTLAMKTGETLLKQDDDGRTFRVGYEYDNVRMCLDAQVYAVQTHNAADAIKSAWGKTVSVGSSGTLTFLD